MFIVRPNINMVIFADYDFLFAISLQYKLWNQFFLQQQWKSFNDVHDSVGCVGLMSTTIYYHVLYVLPSCLFSIASDHSKSKLLLFADNLVCTCEYLDAYN